MPVARPDAGQLALFQEAACVYCGMEGGRHWGTCPAIRQAASKAHARRTDPQTSHEAARSVERIRERQQAVLDLLRRRGPMCDEEIARTYAGVAGLPAQSPSGLRTRRAELVDMGLVEDSGERVTLASGRRSIRWQARNGARGVA